MATSRATVEILALLRDGVSAPLRGIRGAIAATFSGLRGVLGAGLGATFLLAVKSVADTETALLRLSRTTRSSVEDVSALKFALDDLGIGSNNLKELLNQLEGKRADALRGGGQARNAFQQLGVDIQELKTLGGIDILKQLGDAYLRAGQSATSAAQLQAIFGDRFREFLPLLAQGTRGFDELTQRAKALGAVVSSEDAVNAERFSRAYLEFATVATGLFRELANVLLPQLTVLIQRLRSLLGQDTIQERARQNALADLEEMQRLNRELGREFTGRFSENVIEAFKQAGAEFERLDAGGLIKINNPDELLGSLRKAVQGAPPIQVPAVLVPAEAGDAGFFEGFKAQVESTREELGKMFEFGKFVAKETSEVLVDNFDKAFQAIQDGAKDTRDVFKSLIDGIIADLTELARRELLKRVFNQFLGLFTGGTTTTPGQGSGGGLNIPDVPGSITGASLGGGRLIGGSGNKRLNGGLFGGPQSFGGGGTVINLSSNATAEQQRELVSTIMRHEASRNRQVRVAFRMP